MNIAKIFFILLTSIFFIACNTPNDVKKDENKSELNTTLNKEVNTSKFNTKTVTSIKEVDCKLSNGQASICYEITIQGFPADRAKLGPNCPTTITTEAKDSGKWFDKGILYDATGEFVKNLDTFYNDPEWKLYDETTGKIRITNTQESCEAAARPDVDAKYTNHCVECDISYYSKVVEKGIESTFTIPKIPVPTAKSNSIGRGGVGVALDGVKMDSSAPTDAILAAHTIAAFDDCVGHVNPHVGYHYHGANQGEGTCPSIPFEKDGHSGMIGYALDGYAIYGMLDKEGKESEDLDNCRGHSDAVRGYHYHAAGAGENTFIGCFKGETAIVQGQEGQPPFGERPDGPPPNGKPPHEVEGK